MGFIPLTFEQLKQSAQIYVNEWTTVTVRDEPLLPDYSGTYWLSVWDNWLLPTASPVPFGALSPIITQEQIVLNPTTDYTVTGGDSIRGTVQLTIPAGPDAIVLATYRRTIFRDAFWTNNLTQASAEIAGRLLQCSYYDINNLDPFNDPWMLIVKQSGRNALANLQTMLSGLGKTQMEGMTIDTSRAALGLSDTLNQLGEEIDRQVVAWRWRNSPNARAVTNIHPLINPYGAGWSWY